MEKQKPKSKKISEDERFNLVKISMLRLDMATKKFVPVKKDELTLSEIIDKFKLKIKKLMYKSYGSLKEKHLIIDELFIYYNNHNEFRNYCKEHSFSHYFLRYHRADDEIIKIEIGDKN